MKKRFIFDLDGTILESNFSETYEYFDSILPEEYSIKFRKYCDVLLDEYEKTFPKYDKTLLSKFLSKKLGFTITENMISTWIDLAASTEDIICPDAIEVLEYLRSKDKSIVILTNWFRKSQVERLEKQLLLPYFDQVYAGDSFLKPSKTSYQTAAGNYKIEECVMIGDNLEKDILGARKIGMDAIHCHHENNETKDSIKTLKKIKEMY